MSLVGIIIWAGWVFSLYLREFSQALVAHWAGDTSLKNKGSLIFNPFERYKHVAPIHRVIFILFLIMGGVWLPGGIAYINQRKIRNRLLRSIVAAARPISSILISLILSFYFQNITRDILIIESKITGNLWLPVSIAFLAYLQVFTAVFNLIPIPGLDGYDIIDPWLSNHVRSKFNYLRKYNTLIIIGLLWWSAFSFQLIEIIVSKTLKIQNAFIEAGLFSFQQTLYLIFSFVFFMLVIWIWDLNYPSNITNKSQDSVKRKATVANRPDRGTHRNPTGNGNTVKEKVNISSQVHPETRRRAIALASYDKDRIERLLNGVRLKNPDRSEQWYWEKILYDMERDRGF
jgi:Zn-dependent protease